MRGPAGRRSRGQRIARTRETAGVRLPPPCSSVLLWISLSATVIMYNKWVLSYYGAPAAPACLSPVNRRSPAPPTRPRPADRPPPRRRLPLPGCAHAVAHVLLLGTGDSDREDGVRRDSQHEHRHLLQGYRAHWLPLRRHAVAGKLGLPLPQRILHPDAQGEPASSCIGGHRPDACTCHRHQLASTPPPPLHTHTRAHTHKHPAPAPPIDTSMHTHSAPAPPIDTFTHTS